MSDRAPVSQSPRTQPLAASASSAVAGSSAVASSTVPDDWSYEAAVENIEAIVMQLETGDLDLAKVFERFEQAVGQLRQCEQFLKEKQQQVDLLVETLEDSLKDSQTDEDNF